MSNAVQPDSAGIHHEVFGLPFLHEECGVLRLEAFARASRAIAARLASLPNGMDGGRVDDEVYSKVQGSAARGVELCTFKC